MSPPDAPDDVALNRAHWDAVSDEYQELFIGVGKSEVSLYASSYMKAPAGSELADVRAALARLGLSRQPRVNVFEDHLALMCETMRTLIAGTRENLPADLVVQKKFFHDHIEPWVFECCDVIKMHPIANYYRRVAEFTDRFMAIERDSFAIE